ncbi:MAG: hypothetical protein WCO51_11725, partial [bacterium]
ALASWDQRRYFTTKDYDQWSKEIESVKPDEFSSSIAFIKAASMRQSYFIDARGNSHLLTRASILLWIQKMELRAKQLEKLKSVFDKFSQ